jgi:hypothetical protein
MGEWRYSSTILDLGTRWRWVVRSRPGRFTFRKEPRYPLDRSLGGSQSWFGRCWVQKRPCSCQKSNLGLLASSPLLYRLSYTYSCSLVSMEQMRNTCTRTLSTGNSTAKSPWKTTHTQAGYIKWFSDKRSLKFSSGFKLPRTNFWKR